MTYKEMLFNELQINNICKMKIVNQSRLKTGKNTVF